MRVRERMVVSRRPGATEMSRNTVRTGGSSSDFSSAFAAFTLSSSARSTITQRHMPSSVCAGKEALELADFVDRDRAWKLLGLQVVSATDDEQPRMRERPHLPVRCGVGADLESFTRPLAGLRQEEAREPICECRLADALRTTDQPAVMQSA